MKKAIASALATASYFMLTAPAFAQTVVADPCQDLADDGSGFSNLCFLEANGKTIQNIVFAVLVIATVVALFFLIWGGFKWVTSGGDKAKVDAARQTIIAAIIGLILSFLAFFILSLVLGFFGIKFSNLRIPTITGTSDAPPGLTTAELREQCESGGGTWLGGPTNECRTSGIR